MKTDMKTDTITLPAAWACALINGDYTGFDFSAEDGGEALRCSTAEDRLTDEGWTIVSCDDEPRLTWHYRLYDPGAACNMGEVLDYTIIQRQQP